MKWTQAHARAAVAAKARRRVASAVAPDVEVATPVFALRRPSAKWRLQIRDLEHGDSLTLRLYRLPWPARFVDSDHREHSARSIAKLVQTILTQGYWRK